MTGCLLPSQDDLLCESQLLLLEFDPHTSQYGRLTAELFETKSPTTRRLSISGAQRDALSPKKAHCARHIVESQYALK